MRYHKSLMAVAALSIGLFLVGSGLPTPEVVTVVVTATPPPTPTSTPTPPGRITTSPMSKVPTTPSLSAPTSTVAPTREGNVVHGSVYGIKLISAERTSDPVLVGVKNNIPQYLNPSPDHIILKVEVEFYKNGTLLMGTDIRTELPELSVLDSSGKLYKPFDSYNMILEQDGTFRTTIVYFDIAKNVPGFKLAYRDVGLIDLNP